MDLTFSSDGGYVLACISHPPTFPNTHPRSFPQLFEKRRGVPKFMLNNGLLKIICLLIAKTTDYIPVSKQVGDGGGVGDGGHTTLS